MVNVQKGKEFFTRATGGTRSVARGELDGTMLGKQISIVVGALVAAWPPWRAGGAAR